MGQEKINGDYTLSVTITDLRTDKNFTKKLGSIQINFNEGSNEG